MQEDERTSAMFRYTTVSLFVVGLLVCTATVSVQGQTKEEKVKAFTEQRDKVLAGKGDGGLFMGASSCRACHTMKKMGAQYKKWSDGPHAKAFASLFSEEGKKRAAAKGIETPEADEKCLKCHAPIALVPSEAVKPSKKKPKTPADAHEGVSCEVCHGSSEKHIELAKAARKEKKDVPPEAFATLLKANDPDLRVALCGDVCHAANDMHDLEARDLVKAWEEIAHPRPAQ